jgi:predicted RNase H-like HicB family nuclease
MTYYLALIEHGKTFGLVFPDCPGCVAQADTFDEVMENGVEALREWMADRVSDGFTPPAPRGITELRADASLADDFAADPVVASVPLLLDAGRYVRANISLDAGLLEQIDAAAKLRGLTRSAFLSSAAREKIAAGR